jgi:hypothetical protein
MRRVAAHALGVLRGSEDWLLGVARGTGGDILLAERVRCVAARTRWMSGGEGLGLGDAGTAATGGVAAHAALVGGSLGLVHRVTVEAATYPRMLGLVILVTRGACRRLQRRRPVSAMAVAARLIRVCTDGGDVDTLRLIMAAHAGRGTDRQILAEAVTVLACGRLDDADHVGAVQRSRDLAMAAAAQIDGRRHEPCLVTVATRDVRTVDVRAMAGAVAHRAPDRWHVLGDPARPCVAARGHHDAEHHDAEHQRAPTG